MTEKDDALSLIARQQLVLLKGMAGLRTDTQTEIGSLRADMLDLRVAVMDRSYRVENRLTAIRDDMTVTMGRADRAHGAADSTRDELRMLSQEVSVLTRQQMRISARLDEIEKGGS